MKKTLNFGAGRLARVFKERKANNGLPSKTLSLDDKILFTHLCILQSIFKDNNTTGRYEIDLSTVFDKDIKDITSEERSEYCEELNKEVDFIHLVDKIIIHLDPENEDYYFINKSLVTLLSDPKNLPDKDDMIIIMIYLMCLIRLYYDNTPDDENTECRYIMDIRSDMEEISMYVIDDEGEIRTKVQIILGDTIEERKLTLHKMKYMLSSLGYSILPNPDKIEDYDSFIINLLDGKDVEIPEKYVKYIYYNPPIAPSMWESIKNRIKSFFNF